MPGSRCSIASVLFVALSAVGVSAQTLYQCKAGIGTVFQDLPCLSGQKRVLSDSEVRDVSRTLANAAKAKAEDDVKSAEAERLRTETEGAERQALVLAKAICGEVYGKPPQIGQPSRQVRTCFGAPGKMNVTTTVNGTQEQWVYENWGYVYISEAELVRAVQRRQ